MIKKNYDDDENDDNVDDDEHLSTYLELCQAARFKQAVLKLPVFEVISARMKMLMTTQMAFL